MRAHISECAYGLARALARGNLSSQDYANGSSYANYKSPQNRKYSDSLIRQSDKPQSQQSSPVRRRGSHGDRAASFILEEDEGINADALNCTVITLSTRHFKRHTDFTS